MTVELITTATPEIHEAMGRLIPQLSRSAAPMSEADVERFLAQSGVHLFVFRPDTADAEGKHPILGKEPASPSSSPRLSTPRRSAPAPSISPRAPRARPRTASTSAPDSSCARPTCTA